MQKIELVIKQPNNKDTKNVVLTTKNENDTYTTNTDWLRQINRDMVYYVDHVAKETQSIQQILENNQLRHFHVHQINPKVNTQQACHDIHMYNRFIRPTPVSNSKQEATNKQATADVSQHQLIMVTIDDTSLLFQRHTDAPKQNENMLHVFEQWCIDYCKDQNVEQLTIQMIQDAPFIKTYTNMRPVMEHQNIPIRSTQMIGIHTTREHIREQTTKKTACFIFTPTKEGESLIVHAPYYGSHIPNARDLRERILKHIQTIDNGTTNARTLWSSIANIPDNQFNTSEWTRVTPNTPPTTIHYTSAHHVSDIEYPYEEA